MPGPTLPRRHLLAGGLAALTVQAPPAAAQGLPLPPTPVLRCRIMRRGVKIGEAEYAFSGTGTGTGTGTGAAATVVLHADLRVRIGFITLFHYTHENHEQWQGANLAGFYARTDRNGQRQWSQGTRNPDGLHVSGSGTAPYIAPPHSIDASYWAERCMQDNLIDSQTGKMLSLRISAPHPGQAQAADGSHIDATEYDVTGDLRMTLWYQNNFLAGMVYYAHDGSALEYQRL